MATELNKLSAPHHLMVDLYLQGFKPGEIAQQLGYTRQGVTFVMASPAFQDALARRRRDHEQVHDQTVASTVVEARAKIDSLALRATEKLAEHLENQDPRVSMISVKEILDRADGLQPSLKPIQVDILDAARMQLLLLALRESGRQPLVEGELIRENAA